MKNDISIGDYWGTASEEYGDESWELDALEPSYLRNLIEDELQLIRDDELWDEAVEEQEEQRAIIASLVEQVQ